MTPSRTPFGDFGKHTKDPISVIITKELAGLKENSSCPSILSVKVKEATVNYLGRQTCRRRFGSQFLAGDLERCSHVLHIGHVEHIACHGIDANELFDG